jgi:DNA (cytosine-5)-methyltransferase 1
MLLYCGVLERATAFNAMLVQVTALFGAACIPRGDPGFPSAQVKLATRRWDSPGRAMRTFFEFFAGGGMARAGFGPNWQCVFANDFDPKKAASYAQNWGASELLVGDVAAVSVAELPGRADLAWASFPCQDLSLAGIGAGLQGTRSGTFWPFWRLIEQLNRAERAPKLIVLENVCGALTSHGGKDFVNICGALSDAGYDFGAIVIDAVRFVPQSRPRLFIVGVKHDNASLLGLSATGPNPTWHSPALVQAFKKLPAHLKTSWHWWTLPAPKKRTVTFADLV